MGIGWYVLDADHSVRGPYDDMAHPDVRAQLEDGSLRRVAETHVGPYWVSTVFLGLDHAFMGGPPQLFETMVFGPPPARPWHDLFQRRYATWDEAIAGHAVAVAEVSAYEWKGDAMVRWRTGRKNGRTIYVQRGTEPDALDAMIGAMDTERMSRLVVDCVNRYFDEHPDLIDYGVEPTVYQRSD